VINRSLITLVNRFLKEEKRSSCVRHRGKKQQGMTSLSSTITITFMSFSFCFKTTTFTTPRCHLHPVLFQDEEKRMERKKERKKEID
jgi:hypothetical protein